MTILNILVEREHALVGIDTQAVLADGARHDISKVLPLVHFNAVLAGRGNPLGIFFCLAALSFREANDFDSFADAIPSLLPQLAEPPQPIKQAIALVGWSPRHSRMIGRVFTRLDLEAGFVARDIEAYYLAPDAPSIIRNRDFNDPAGMIPFARAQKKLMEEQAPDAAAGGRLIVIQLTRRGMTIEPVCEL